MAREQEMKAAVQEMRAKVVEAEAEVPKAMAAALREGKLGVMDYYNMRNVMADTQMRNPYPEWVEMRYPTPTRNKLSPEGRFLLEIIILLIVISVIANIIKSAGKAQQQSRRTGRESRVRRYSGQGIIRTGQSASRL